MKILFLINSLSVSGGGAERVLAAVSSALPLRGHEVTVASFDEPNQEQFYKLDAAVRHVALGVGKLRIRTEPREVARRLVALRSLATREVKPDVAVGFMHISYIPLGLSLLGTGIPVVASEHTSYDHYTRFPLQASVLRLSPPLFNAMTTVSPTIRAGFPARIRKRMATVPNPVTVQFRPRGEAIGGGGPSKTLLAVGSLEAHKDHKTLIGAFSRIADHFPDWCLRIVGEGSLRGSLAAQIATLDLSDRVCLPGPVSRIEDEYMSADLFVMPSSYESFGLSTAEALAAGLPAVGFASCPGTNELIQDGVNGLLVDGPDRTVALAAGLSQLMGSAGDRQAMGRAGPLSVVDYSLDAVVRRWEDLLESVTAGRWAT